MARFLGVLRPWREGAVPLRQLWLPNEPENRSFASDWIKGCLRVWGITGNTLMLQLVYVSSSTWAMSFEDLNAILDASRENNRRSGVTGMLLHLDHGFLQILEGPRDAVMDIFNRIERDARHVGVRILLERESDERLFDEWTMGFDKPSPATQQSDPVFEITREAIDHAIEPKKAAELAVLLRNFYYVNAGNSAA